MAVLSGVVKSFITARLISELPGAEESEGRVDSHNPKPNINGAQMKD